MFDLARALFCQHHLIFVLCVWECIRNGFDMLTITHIDTVILAIVSSSLLYACKNAQQRQIDGNFSCLSMIVDDISL